MRVLIDATGVTRRKAGVGVYAKNLIEQLVAAGGLELFLAVQDDDPDWEMAPRAGLTVIRLPSRWMRKVAVRLLYEQTWLPWLLRRHRIEVVHSLHYSFPLLRLGTRSVVTIHDLTSFSMPGVHLGLKLRYFRFYLQRARRGADGLIFVSRSAEQDFRARFGAARGVMRVVHHGKSPAFRPGWTAAEVERVRARHGLPERYILYVGTIEPRKNLERLVEAFAGIAGEYPETKLVIAGMMGWKQEHLPALVERRGLVERVVFPGFVAEEDKPALIGGCALFCYPSLYEGFGLPVLEGMASGVPVITSDVSSLPEVAGDGAVLVDPTDVGALEGAMRAVLGDPELAAALGRRGIAQAAGFTWERAAAETAAMYREAGRRR